MSTSASISAGSPQDSPLRSRYWLDESFQVTVETPTGRRQHVVAKPFAIIGGHTQADVRLPEIEIPKRALFLLACSDGIFYVYLESEPPDRRPLAGWLAANDWLSIGRYRVSVRPQRSAGEIPSLPGLLEKGSAAHPYPVVLVNRDGKALGHRRYRSRLNLIGKREMPDPRRPLAFTSSFRSAILWEQGRLWVIDLLRKHPTRVDGRAVDAAVLPMGGVAELGDIKLVFHRLSSGSPSAEGRDEGESSIYISGDSLSTTSSSGIGDSAVSARTLPAVPSPPNSAAVDELFSQEHPLDEGQWQRWREDLEQQRESLRTQREELESLERERQAQERARQEKWRGTMARHDERCAALAAQQAELIKREKTKDEEHARFREELARERSEFQRQRREWEAAAETERRQREDQEQARLTVDLSAVDEQRAALAARQAELIKRERTWDEEHARSREELQSGLTLLQERTDAAEAAQAEERREVQAAKESLARERSEFQRQRREWEAAAETERRQREDQEQARLTVDLSAVDEQRSVLAAQQAELAQRREIQASQESLARQRAEFERQRREWEAAAESERRQREAEEQARQAQCRADQARYDEQRAALAAQQTELIQRVKSWDEEHASSREELNSGLKLLQEKTAAAEAAQAEQRRDIQAARENLARQRAEHERQQREWEEAASKERRQLGVREDELQRLLAELCSREAALVALERELTRQAASAAGGASAAGTQKFPSEQELVATYQEIEALRAELDQEQRTYRERLASFEEQSRELEARARSLADRERSFDHREQSLDHREQSLDEREIELTRMMREVADEERLSRSLVSSYATVAVSAEPPVETSEDDDATVRTTDKELVARTSIISERLSEMGEARRRRNLVIVGLVVTGLLALALGVVYVLFSP